MVHQHPQINVKWSTELFITMNTLLHLNKLIEPNNKIFRALLTAQQVKDGLLSLSVWEWEMNTATPLLTVNIPPAHSWAVAHAIRGHLWAVVGTYQLSHIVS